MVVEEEADVAEVQELEGFISAVGDCGAGVVGSAIYTSNRRHRLFLSRQWNAELTTLGVLLLNPSTANGTVGDKTTARAITIAKERGHGRVVLVNVYTYSDSDPDNLRAQEAKIHARRDEFIEKAIAESDELLVAIGCSVDAREDMAQVVALIPEDMELICLGRNQDHSPRHLNHRSRNGLICEPFSWDDWIVD